MDLALVLDEKTTSNFRNKTALVCEHTTIQPKKMLQIESNLTQVEPKRKKKMKCGKKTSKRNTLANKIHKQCVPQKEVVMKVVITCGSCASETLQRTLPSTSSSTRRKK